MRRGGAGLILPVEREAPAVGGPLPAACSRHVVTLGNVPTKAPIELVVAVGHAGILYFADANKCGRRRVRLRCVRNALRRVLGGRALRVVLPRKRRATLAALARQAARVHLAAQPNAALCPLLHRDARGAGLQLRGAKARAERRADGGADG